MESLDEVPLVRAAPANRRFARNVTEATNPERIAVVDEPAALPQVVPPVPAAAPPAPARLVEVRPVRRQYQQLQEMEEVVPAYQGRLTPARANTPALGNLRDHNHVHGFNGRNPEEYNKAFNTIADYMPEFPYRGLTRTYKVIYAIAICLALLASLYNAQFAGTFGSFLSKAAALTWYLSVMAFAANVPINFNSIKLSVAKVSSDLLDRWKPNRLPLPDDGQIKRGIWVKAGLAAIGAIPPILFSIDKPLFGMSVFANWGVYLTLMGTQLIVVGAQNLRGLTKDDDMLKQEAVFYHREILLNKIADCLGEELTEQMRKDVKLMATGRLYAPPTSKLKAITGKALGYTYFAYIGLHAAATGYSVIRKLKAKFFEWFGNPVTSANIIITNSTLTSAPLIPVGSLGYDGFMVAAGGASIISGVERWLLLGRSAQGFVDNMFTIGNRPLFKLGEIEIVDSVFPTNSPMRKIMPFVSGAISVTVGVSSLGSASQISHANFFNDSPDAGLLLASFAIGGGAAGPINTLDFKGLLDTVCGYIYIFFQSKRAGYDPSARFGASMTEFLLKFMRKIASMSVSDFASKYLVTFNSRIQEIDTDFARMGITEQQRDACIYMREAGLCGVGYARNSVLKELYDKLEELKDANNDLFLRWKQNKILPEAERRAFRKRQVVPPLSVDEDGSPTAYSGPDEKTPLAYEGSRNSIN